MTLRWCTDQRVMISGWSDLVTLDLMPSGHLGGRRVDVGQDDREATWTVLGDPEGNEFCVLSSRER